MVTSPSRTRTGDTWPFGSVAEPSGATSRTLANSTAVPVVERTFTFRVPAPRISRVSLRTGVSHDALWPGMSRPRAPARSETEPAPGTLLIEEGRPPAGLVTVAEPPLSDSEVGAAVGSRSELPSSPTERCQAKTGPVETF